ncbi:MAG: FHA domain-containing protein [Planctomycetota bacterium]
MFYRLSVIQPSELERESWILSLPATIGRDPQHEVCIDHDSISRTHCRLALNSHEALTLRDLNSMNGTYVNDEKLSRPVVLKPGDVFQCGGVLLAVEITSDTDHGKQQPSSQPLSSSKLATTTKMQNITEQLNAAGAVAGDKSDDRKWWQFWS